VIGPEQLATAYGFASEKTKQLITLSIAVITVTISFSKDIVGGVAAWTVLLLAGAWILYLSSVIFGVQLLGRFAARLTAEPINADSLNSTDICIPARRQVRCFLAGVVLTVAFGISTLWVSIHDVGGLGKRLTKVAADSREPSPCSSTPSVHK
jgi:hypothetical protein